MSRDHELTDGCKYRRMFMPDGPLFKSRLQGRNTCRRHEPDASVQKEKENLRGATFTLPSHTSNQVAVGEGENRGGLERRTCTQGAVMKPTSTWTGHDETINKASGISPSRQLPLQARTNWEFGMLAMRHVRFLRPHFYCFFFSLKETTSFALLPSAADEPKDKICTKKTGEREKTP